MKKIKLLLISVLLVLSLVACGESSKNTYDPSDGNVTITKDMLDDIREVVLDGEGLSFSHEYSALSVANARIGVMSGYEHMKEFTSIKITSGDYYDDWHYRFYGQIYGKDSYNSPVKYKFYYQVKCAEDSTEEKGYKIERDGIGIEIK